jgi:glucose/arabinose dehydrogenase
MWVRKMRVLAFPLLISTLVCCVSAPEEQSLSPVAEEEVQLRLPEGFVATLVADELGAGRHLAVRENGDIYLALRTLQDGFGIVGLRDTNGDGEADVIRRFGEHAGTGIAIRGEHLYFASDLAVYRYQLGLDELVPEDVPELIVEGFLEQRQHAVKPFAFDKQGHIYVNVGAPSNACQEKARTPGSPGLDPCPQLERQAGIWRFSADQVGQTQIGNGTLYAGGIRNAVAIAWNGSVGCLYAVQHGRDQLHQLWPDLFSTKQSAELPAEEFLLVKEGSNFSWPYCYFDQFQEKRILAPEYGGDGSKEGTCDQFDKPILAFPGHWAPNDLLFYGGDQFPEVYRNGAFIAFHGSWNRAPEAQAGYSVVFVPFDGSEPSGGWKVFAEGFAGSEEILSPREASYRPTGLAQGPDGSLYISDSRKGRIWRVTFNGA